MAGEIKAEKLSEEELNEVSGGSNFGLSDRYNPCATPGCSRRAVRGQAYCVDCLIRITGGQQTTV